MAVKTRIDSFSKTYEIIVNEALSRPAQQKAIARFARDKIDAADAINMRALGRVPPKTITVDGRRDAPLESVNPDRGRIIAEWRMVEDVLAWIYATLKQRSPVISGAYRRGHKLYADNVEANPSRPPLASEYLFLNTVPYARKIEIGKTKAGRNFVIQVDPKIYQRTAQDARAKFGNIAKVSFTYSSAFGSESRSPAIRVSL
jgi:hypothetical protein